MSPRFHRFMAWTLIASVLSTGCSSVQPFYLHEDGDLSHYLDVATDVEYTDVDHATLDEVTMTREPRTILNPNYDKIWDLTLEEAMSITLQNSKVIRSFGQVRQFGQILGGPPERITSGAGGVTTIYDPAIQESGQTGVEQAIAAFDAVFNFNTTWDRQDRPQNFTSAVGGGRATLKRDQVTINSEITKRTVVGSQWSVRNVTTYEDVLDSRLPPILPTNYFTALETEFRQPLLRNRGVQVNRVPIVLARIQTDIAIANVEFDVRNLVNEVERAYWELYFFYRNLSAAKTGHDSALATWQRVNALNLKGGPGGEAQFHARASEQYFFFKARVEEAFRDLYKSETRLRYLMGISPNDGQMIRPVDEPTLARVDFDWHQILEEGLTRSVELRRQNWTIRQRELQLIAARNQLLPQLDVVGTYRWLGLGDQFDSSNRVGANFPAVGSTAVDELLEGGFQEHQLGIQSQIPLGFRAQMANVRNAQLSLVREQARVEDMELEVVNQLYDAVGELVAHYKLTQTNLNRRAQAKLEVDALKVALEAGTATLDLLLDAQRRQAESEIAYYQALVEYNLAIMSVHFRKGSLLDYNGVVMAEGPWPAKAYCDAHQRARRRDASYYLDYGYSRPNVVSAGPVTQNPGGVTVTGEEGLSGEGLQFGDENGMGTEVIPSPDGMEPTPAESLPSSPFNSPSTPEATEERLPVGDETSSVRTTGAVEETTIEFGEDMELVAPTTSMNTRGASHHSPSRQSPRPRAANFTTGAPAYPLARPMTGGGNPRSNRSSLRGSGTAPGGVALQWKE